MLGQEDKSFESFFVKTEKPKAHVTLLVGDTGSGKTYTAMSFPEPIFIIDTESRAMQTKYYNYKDKDIKIFQPIQFKTQYKADDEDPLDSHATIKEISKFIISLANKVKSGEITKGTIIVDSSTDIWSLIQDWAIYELSQYTSKDGSKKADTTTGKFSNTFDWGIPNKKHQELMGTLRSLSKYGIYIVFTAREREIPEYVKEKPTLKVLIRAHKDIPFLADNTFMLKKQAGQFNVKYEAVCIKLGGLSPPIAPIENLTFDKLQTIREEQEKKVGK